MFFLDGQSACVENSFSRVRTPRPAREDAIVQAHWAHPDASSRGVPGGRWDQLRRGVVRIRDVVIEHRKIQITHIAPGEPLSGGAVHQVSRNVYVHPLVAGGDFGRPPDPAPQQLLTQHSGDVRERVLVGDLEDIRLFQPEYLFYFPQARAHRQDQAVTAITDRRARSFHPINPATTPDPLTATFGAGDHQPNFAAAGIRALEESPVKRANPAGRFMVKVRQVERLGAGHQRHFR